MKRYINGIRRPFTTKGRWSPMLIFVGVLFLLLFVRSFFLMQVEISYDRKDLGLQCGDRVVVSRLSHGLRLPIPAAWGYYRWGDCMPKIGEIVVYDYPDGSGRISLDRVTALPGDTLWLDMSDKSFTVIPSKSYALGRVVVPEEQIIGRPFAISYSVEDGEPFYRLLRPDRLFIAIE